MYFDSFKKNECSGCTACMSACPKSAITMHEDDEGFLYPVINEDTCIHCGICRKVCSWEHPLYDNSPEPLTLAAVLKDKVERQRSTSGGVFYAIAKWVIEHNGMVYGAAFDEQLQLKHIGVDNLDDLQKLRGSKYIQSNLGLIFKNIKSHLEQGRFCYFTGTGCQVAGLKAYLHKDYEKLITSDLVCHGAPSQKLFNEHIAYMEKKYHDKVVDYKFRDYKWGVGCEACSFANRKTIIKPTYELSPYLYSFMYAYTYRYSCYECKFAKVPRQGDISLADFWGVKNFFPRFDNTNGCSLVLINSNKGDKIWDQVKGQFDYNISKVVDAAKHNGNVVRPSEMPAQRAFVYKEIIDKGYDYVAKDYFRCPHYYRVMLISFVTRMSVMQFPLKVYRKMKVLLRLYNN